MTLALTLAMLALVPDAPRADVERLARSIVHHCAEPPLSPALCAAVAYHESTFNRHAVSVDNACGTMQVLASKYDNSGCEMLADVEIGVAHGAYWLRYYWRHCGVNWLGCYRHGWKGGKRLTGYQVKVSWTATRIQMDVDETLRIMERITTALRGKEIGR